MPVSVGDLVEQKLEGGGYCDPPPLAPVFSKISSTTSKIAKKERRDVDREIVRRIVDEARGEEANLVIWDKRDTFTVEPKAGISVEDDYLKVEMEDGRATVYVDYDSIYKLVVEKERSRRPGARTGFGAVGS